MYTRRHFRNEEETGSIKLSQRLLGSLLGTYRSAIGQFVKKQDGDWADKAFSMTAGIAIGDVPVSYWPVCFPCSNKQSHKSLRKSTLYNFLLVSKVANIGSNF